jgi:selenocysteine lyase/cysteine desulfurase
MCVMMALGQSLPYIRVLGVEKIQAYRQPMIKKLQQEMPRLGFEQITPPESASALLCYGLKGKNSRSIFERLRERTVHVRVGSNYLRISPSVFNDMGDIDELLEALA